MVYLRGQPHRDRRPSRATTWTSTGAVSYRPAAYSHTSCHRGPAGQRPRRPGPHRPPTPPCCRHSCPGSSHPGKLPGDLPAKIGTLKAAGAVNVVYGTADGLKSDNSQLFSQGANGIGETAAEWDRFGIQTTWGDFNNDGYSDLAVSATGEDGGAGAVNVMYGSASGLTSTSNQVFKQGVDGMQGLRTGSELFGWALATGDFNGDGYDDLAVGASDEKVGTAQYAGAVHIIYGSGSGLTATGNQMWSQDTIGIEGIAEYIDYFGSELARATSTATARTISPSPRRGRMAPASSTAARST